MGEHNVTGARWRLFEDTLGPPLGRRGRGWLGVGRQKKEGAQGEKEVRGENVIR